MRRNSPRMYWMTNPDWYRCNYGKDCFELTDEVPARARRSFAMWNRPERPRKSSWHRRRDFLCYSSFAIVGLTMFYNRKRIRRLLKRIYLYFKGKEIWDAKMSESLKITVISTPANRK